MTHKKTNTISSLATIINTPNAAVIYYVAPANLANTTIAHRTYLDYSNWPLNIGHHHQSTNPNFPTNYTNLSNIKNESVGTNSIMAE